MKNLLVSDWRGLWKSWSLIVAVIGAVVPELLQLVADNTDLMPWLDTSLKSAIRLACLVLVVLVRPIRQLSMTPKDPQ